MHLWFKGGKRRILGKDFSPVTVLRLALEWNFVAWEALNKVFIIYR